MSLVVPSLRGMSSGGSGVRTVGPQQPAAAFALGLNLSGAENPYPFFPTLAEMSYWASQGVRQFRFPTLWECIQPTNSGPLDTDSTNYQPPNGGDNTSYMDCCSQVLANAKSVGCKVLFDVHNFGRKGGIIGTDGGAAVADFVDLWHRLSLYFLADPSYDAVVGYDLMNEWRDMDPNAGPGVNSTDYSKALIATCNQRAVNAIRANGDRKTIHIEGDHYSGAWDWVINNGAWAAAMTDSANNLIFHVHSYLDHDSSGLNFAYAVEAARDGYAPPGAKTSPTIGITRLTPVVQWAAANRKRLCVGETGWGSDDPSTDPNGSDDPTGWNTCARNMLDFCSANEIEVYVWGNGPGFGLGYGYSGAPENLNALGQKDFSGSGFPSSQLVVIREYTGFTGPQDETYKLEMPSTGGVVPRYALPLGQPYGGDQTFRTRIKYHGVLAAPVTFTPYATLADGVTPAPGSFAPATVTLQPAENPSAGFTFTPTAANTIKLGARNNAGWTEPGLQAISSIDDVYHAQFQDRVPATLVSLRNEFTPFVGPVVRLQRTSDGQQRDFFFDNAGNLPRQAMQDWASARVIPLVTAYYTNGTGDAAQQSGGRGQMMLNLQNADGYPEIVFPVGAAAGMDVKFDARSAPLASIVTRVHPGNGDQFLREDYYAGPIVFSLGNFAVTDPRNTGVGNPGTGYSENINQSRPTDAYHTFGATFRGGVTDGMKIMLDAQVSASADTTPYAQLHTFGDYGNDSRFQWGWFNYYGGSYFEGVVQSLRMWRDEITAAEQAILKQADDAYYSTPLPDALNNEIAPVITGTSSGRAMIGRASTPLGAISVTDGNPSPTETATITLSGAAATIQFDGYNGPGPHTTAAMLPADLTTALRALTFVAGGADGSTTTLTLHVVSNAGPSAMAAETITQAAVAPGETAYPAPSTTFVARAPKGVNISGGEIGTNSTRPYGYDYIYPQNSEIDYFSAKGFGLIRMPVDLRRLQPQSYGPLDPAPHPSGAPSGGDLASVKSVLDYALGKGTFVVIDPHNYGYIADTANGGTPSIGASAEATAQFVDFWKRIAQKFKNYPNVIFGLMNEPVNMSVQQWHDAAVQAIAAIASVTTARLVLIPGGATYTGAHDWVSSGNGAAWAGYVPPSGLSIAFEMHQYLDDDNSGSHSTVVAGKGSTVLGDATNWLRTNGFKGYLMEFGWSSNDSQSSGGVPSTEGNALLDFIGANTDVWSGWSYWLGGSSAFFGAYQYNVVPGGYPSGPFTDKPQLAKLVSHLP